VPVSELHRQVAVVALRAASGYGFALGGGNALIAHGLIDRATQDVDLFTDDEHGVEAAADAVEAALRAVGYQIERQDETAGSPTSGRGWARAWPNGQSPHRADSRCCCSSPTSTVPAGP
jgi:hypothetical protein